MTNEGIHELAGGYVLDALDPEDRRIFESHLEGCSRCQEEVATLGDAATGLALAAEGPAPPTELRERMLESARSEHETVVPLRRRRWTPAWTAAAAAAACLAIGLGVWATLGGSNGSRAREPQTLALKGATGSLVVDRVGNATLVLSGLGHAPRGKTYEIWVIPKGGKPAPAGLFTFGGHVKLERKVPAGSTVAVTVEHAGGVKAPTGAIRFSAEVPA
jgi:anti-sigma-K factor RskA